MLLKYKQFIFIFTKKNMRKHLLSFIGVVAATLFALKDI
jgi:hypothetical protein